jgi:DegV family protein with EDD domain
MKNKVAFILDSASTLDKEFYSQHNIYVVPMQLIDSNGKQYNDEESSISQQELISNLKSGNLFKSSLSSTGELLNLGEKLLSEFEDVIFIPISYGVSGQYQTAHNVVKGELGDHFHVIKSGKLALCHEFLMHYIIERLLDKPINEILDSINLYLEKNTEIFFAPSTMEGLIKGGRVSGLKGMLANLLHIVPILTVNGEISAIGKAKKYEEACKKMIEKIKEDYKEINEVKRTFGILITESIQDEKKEYILNSIAKEFNVIKEEIIIRQVPNVLLVHT